MAEDPLECGGTRNRMSNYAQLCGWVMTSFTKHYQMRSTIDLSCVEMTVDAFPPDEMVLRHGQSKWSLELEHTVVDTTEKRAQGGTRTWRSKEGVPCSQSTQFSTVFLAEWSPRFPWVALPFERDGRKAIRACQLFCTVAANPFPGYYG